MKTKLLFLLLLVFTGGYAKSQDTIAIDSSTKYQVILGWGHGGGILGHTNQPETMLDSSVANPVNYQLLDFLADDIGLTGSRTWEVGPRIDGTGNDTGNCDVVDWSKFQSNTLTALDAKYLVYFQNRVLAKGIQPNFYSSPGYPTHATDMKPWVVYHPGERAQQIWTSALYLKNTFGINISYDVIYNEPSGSITSTILADDIKALGPRLVAAGLKTKSQFAEAVAPQTDWNFITPVQTDSDLWPWVGRLSYHNYGTADPYRSNIRDFAKTIGITTAQTEMQNPSFDDLYSDLTLGGVSYWEVGYSSSYTLPFLSGLTLYTPGSTYFRLRQVMHYVRPGAVRIGTTTKNSALHVLGFVNKAKVITVIENTSSSRTILLTGLPAGQYGLCQAQSSGTSFQELGIKTVGAGGTLTITANGGNVVTTLYPYAGSNQPPTIMTFKATTGYIVLPKSTDTLIVTANDPELNSLTYKWTVFSQPSGGTASVVSSTAASTGVTGLNVAGNYVFKIDVNDGTNTSSKKVYIVVYASNPPPVLGPAGFRINTPYGLVFSNPGDTTHANIELPTSSVTLQVGIADLANSNFSGRGTWSIVKQPTGGVATVGLTTYIYVSIRASVTGMTVAGDYVFQCVITNPGHPDLFSTIICTVHKASSAPKITSLKPTPASITLPVSSVLLTGVTNDPDGDLMRWWWVVKSAPAGAKPVFDHQGLAVTNVSGLTVAGTYWFTLRVFDDIHMTTNDVKVVVDALPTTIENNSLKDDDMVIFPNPVSTELNIQLKDDFDKTAVLLIYNKLGQKVFENKVSPDQDGMVSVSLELFPAGVYLVKLQSREKVEIRKIVKQ